MTHEMKLQRPFAVFDIDGTLIRWQLYHAVTDSLARQGYLKKEDYQLIKQARMNWKVRGHADAFKLYESQVIQAFEKIITAINAKQFEAAVDSVTREYQDQVYTYTSELIKTLRAKNYVLFAISGSQQELVTRIAALYNFDDCIGTEYVKQDGYFTGEKVFYGNAKQKALQQLLDTYDISSKGSVAVGDSESDIPMLEMVDRAIAFNPTLGLFDEARKRKWEIVVERKNVVYELAHSNHGYSLR